MHRKFVFILVVIGLLAVVSCQQDQVVSKGDVFVTLDSLEHKLDWLDYRLSLENWEMYTTGASDSLAFYTGLYERTVSDPSAWRYLEQGRPYVTEEIDQRRLKLIESAVVRGRIEAGAKVAALRDSLSQIDITFRPQFDGGVSNTNNLYQRYRSDSDRNRRESAYRAWCSVGDELSDGLEQLIRLRNQEVLKLGYNNYFALTFAREGYNIDDYLGLLGRLDSLSSEAYNGIIDRSQKKLGVTWLEVWDLAYAYADVNRRVDRYFPIDSQLTFVKASLKDLGFDLDKLPIYFDLDSRDGKSQFAYAFPIKPPYDIRVMGNLTDGRYSTRTLAHEIGHALHFVNISQDRQLFIHAVPAGWTEGQAQIIASMCEDPDWLRRYAHLPASLVREYQQAAREQAVVNLRMTLTQLMFEYEAYKNPNRDLNKLYWDLFERYMMLPRHDDIKPWAAIIHYTTHPVYLHNYLFGDIITAQTLHTLREMYGGIVGEPAVRSFLVQNYYRFGARYDWRELLERGTGEELNPEYLLRHLGI